MIGKLLRYLKSRTVWALALLTASESLGAGDDAKTVAAKVGAAVLLGAVGSDTLKALTAGKGGAVSQVGKRTLAARGECALNPLDSSICFSDAGNSVPCGPACGLAEK